MSLVKFRKSPWENLLSTDLLDFNPNSLFNDRMWLKRMEEPALNIKEKKDLYEIELAAPGYSKKDFEITIDNGCLNISAKRSETKKEKDENYTRKEFSYESFCRSFAMPENTKEDDIKASYNDGILAINIGKKEPKKSLLTKNIEIK